MPTQVGLLNPRFADDAVMLKDADHFAIPRDDPAAAHVASVRLLDTKLITLYTASVAADLGLRPPPRRKHEYE